MKITKLSIQERNAERVNMFVDDEFFCSLSINTVAKYGLYIQKDITEELLDEVLTYDLQERAFNRAIGYLGKSLKTKRQLSIYLKNLLFKKKKIWYTELDKEASEKIVDKVLDKLEKYSYLNDEEYAEQFILSRIKNKPRGKIILLAELISKGVSKDIAQEKLDSLVDSELSLLKRIYQKKYKDERITIRDKKKIDFLLRKGFNWDLIESFINDESSK